MRYRMSEGMANIGEVLKEAMERTPRPKEPEQEHEVLGFNGWGFPIEKPNKALIEKTADHDVDCLCIDCSMVDEQDDVPWTDKAFERLCENWNNMTSAEFAIVQRFLFGVYAHPPVPTAQPKEPEQEPVAITITGKLGNIYSFTGDYSLKKGDKVYTTPPQRTWVGLTLADKEEFLAQDFGGNRLDAMDWAARKLKEKNNG